MDSLGTPLDFSRMDFTVMFAFSSSGVVLMDLTPSMAAVNSAQADFDLGLSSMFKSEAISATVLPWKGLNLSKTTSSCNYVILAEWAAPRECDRKTALNRSGCSNVMKCPAPGTTMGDTILRALNNRSSDPTTWR